MSLISFADLITPVTEDQFNETTLSALESLGIPARSWRTGGTYRTILRIVARTYAAFSGLVVAAIAGGILETSRGGWLTLLARYVYGIERPDATFATGVLKFTNAGGGVFNFAIGEVTAIDDVTGKAYVNDEAFTLNPGDVKSISIVAKELGTASNANPGDIARLETTLLLVSVVNETPVLAQDAMVDDDLIALCKAKLGTLSNGGPRRAYAFAVRSSKRPDGTAVNINRLTISPSSSIGVVTIYVAAPAGAPDPLDVGYIVDNVELLARPDCVTANVLAASAVAYTRTLTVWATARDGLTEAAIRAAVLSNVDNAIAVYPIGGIPKPPSVQGYLWADLVGALAKAADPSIYHVEGTGADMALSEGKVATLALTVNVRIVQAVAA